MFKVMIPLLCAVSLSQSALSQGEKSCECPKKVIKIENPVIKALQIGDSIGKMNTAGYVTIKNDKSVPILMEKVEFASENEGFADRIELHTHDMDNGTARMRQVYSFIIPAKQTLTLAPGKDHIMFMGVTNDVAVGENIPLNVTFSWNDKNEKKTYTRSVMFQTLSSEHIVNASKIQDSSPNKECCDKS